MIYALGHRCPQTHVNLLFNSESDIIISSLSHLLSICYYMVVEGGVLQE